jgi:histone H3/H4
MADSIIVKAKIKELADKYNVSADFADALDKIVKDLVKRSIERAEANGRRTIMAKDL